MADKKRQIKNEQIASYLKWGLYILLSALFVFGIIIHTGMKQDESRDREAELRRELGLDQPQSSAALSPLDAAFAKLSATLPALRIEGMTEAIALDKTASAGRILRMLSDPAPEVRGKAASLLGSHLVAGSAPSIIPLLSDRDATVRSAAAEALLNFAGDPNLLYGLRTPLSSSDPAVVASALLVWKRAAPSDKNAAIGAVTPILSASDPAVIQDALTAISAVFSGPDLAQFRPYLEAIVARHPGSTAAVTAQDLLSRL